MPNGDRIYAPGKDIRECLDNWHKANRVTSVTVSANFVGTEEAAKMPRFMWAEVDTNVTKQEVEELTMLKNLVMSTQKKIDSTKQKMDSQQRNMGSTTHSQKEVEKGMQNKNKTNESSKPSPALQFKYNTMIEDPNLIGKVANKALNNSVTWSTRKLLFILPDVC